MSMLEYSKLILEKVSFDRDLFDKELTKALQQLVAADKHELMQWVALKFGYYSVVAA
ncbi:MAG: hypothetical protein SFW35_01995 [Chitinophagales bacterium]|nr:hypothetical protein [Chitinophagales bacterium]